MVSFISCMQHTAYHIDDVGSSVWCHADRGIYNNIYPSIAFECTSPYYSVADFMCVRELYIEWDWWNRPLKSNPLAICKHASVSISTATTFFHDGMPQDDSRSEWKLTFASKQWLLWLESARQCWKVSFPSETSFRVDTRIFETFQLSSLDHYDISAAIRTIRMFASLKWEKRNSYEMCA